MDVYEESLEMHRSNKGKLAVVSKVPCRNQKDMTLAYTPGVAAASRAIAEEPDSVYEYTNRGNFVAVVSDGSAVLGLGNIGGLASMPVMEGKAVLFKSFAGIDAFPICLSTQDPDEIVKCCEQIAPTFGGINLEDISAPRCFEVEARLKQSLDIPVFHDDQHGTAIVIMAAMLNALKVVDKKASDVRVAISGAGSAGMANAKILQTMGVRDIVLCDSKGTIYEGRTGGMNPYKEELAQTTNRENLQGTLADAMRDADVFIGVSAKGLVTRDMVSSMADRAIVMAMANPEPEIMPGDAKKAGAEVVCTGRSDYPNQVNNVLGFPGIFRGALDVRASDINEPMKLAAARAIASIISGDEISADYIIPKPYNPEVVPRVACAVAQAAIESGVARLKKSPDDVEANARKMSLLK